MTTIKKHTPAPWHLDSEVLEGKPLLRVRFRVVAKGRTITQCYYSTGDEYAEADARLIAAAPELLAALKDILEVFSLGPLGAAAKYGPDVDVREIEARTVEAGHAAIAKAEGDVPGDSA
jgi:hypothetical protein